MKRGFLPVLGLLLWTASPAHAEELEVLALDVSESDRALAVKIIPDLKDGLLKRGARTATGGQALASHVGGLRHALHSVEQGSASKKGDRLVLVWLHPVRREDPGYLCRDCEVHGVLALLDEEDEVAATTARPLQRSGTEVLQVGGPLVIGKRTLFEVVRRYRWRGVVSEVSTFYRQSKKRLSESGSVPRMAGNEGACGSVDFVHRKRRPLGKKASCGTVWRFTTRAKVRGKKLQVWEELVSAKARRYRLKERSRIVRYTLSRSGKLRASRASLRHGMDG